MLNPYSKLVLGIPSLFYYVQDGNNACVILTSWYESHTPCAVNSIYIISPANEKSLLKFGFGNTIFIWEPLLPL